jgi:hypothetical protein
MKWISRGGGALCALDLNNTLKTWWGDVKGLVPRSCSLNIANNKCNVDHNRNNGKPLGSFRLTLSHHLLDIFNACIIIWTY